MARNRREQQAPAGLSELPPGDVDTDFPNEEKPQEDFAEDAQEQDDSAALRSKIEELEAQLARERAGRGIDVTGGGVSDYWRVELLHAPTHVVASRDPANAWEVYCREMGVISSEYRPKVSPATREEYHEAQAKRHGKKPDEYELKD